MFHNVVVGKPLIEPWHLLAKDENDWDTNEKNITLFTEEKFLPKILVDCGVVQSISEVRRNKKELVKNLDDLDFFKVKWGKKFIWIVVGE